MAVKSLMGGKYGPCAARPTNGFPFCGFEAFLSIAFGLPILCDVSNEVSRPDTMYDCGLYFLIILVAQFLAVSGTVEANFTRHLPEIIAAIRRVIFQPDACDLTISGSLST